MSHSLIELQVKTSELHLTEDQLQTFVNSYHLNIFYSVIASIQVSFFLMYVFVLLDKSRTIYNELQKAARSKYSKMTEYL